MTEINPLPIITPLPTATLTQKLKYLAGLEDIREQVNYGGMAKTITWLQQSGYLKADRPQVDAAAKAALADIEAAEKETRRRVVVEQATSWLKQNTGIAAVLIGQTIALISGIAYIVNWKADIESRVHILEERGSPHLSSINNRLTVTEKETQANKERIDRITEIMLRELPVKREQLKP